MEVTHGKILVRGEKFTQEQFRKWTGIEKIKGWTKWDKYRNTNGLLKLYAAYGFIKQVENGIANGDKKTTRGRTPIVFECLKGLNISGFPIVSEA